MAKNLLNQGWLLSAGRNEGTVWPQAKKCPSEAVARAGDDSEFAAACGTGLDVDGENPLETLRSQHWFRSSRAAMGR
jgi:hypothetical protein